MNKHNLEILKNLSVESRHILSLIQKKGPITKNELLLFAEMKLTSLNRVMAPLEEKGFIIEAGIGKSTGGRKPILYDVNPSKYYVIGVDISRTYTQVVITNLRLEVLSEQKFYMTEYSTPEQTIDNISKILRKMFKQLSVAELQFLGVGVGTVGPLDRVNGIILNPKKFPANGWKHVSVKQLLEQTLQLPVFIDNGANTAVLAEHLFGAGRKLSNIAYFNCGIGIRTGSISGGTVIRTVNDAEDVFGHMVIDVDGEQCYCGNYGCMECYTSIPSIVHKFTSALKKGRLSSISKSLDEIHYQDICRAAQQNDILAREVIEGAAAIFGTGLANYINLLNPRLVILSGPLINDSTLFYQACKEVALKKYYLKEENEIIFNRGGHFKDLAIAVGAAAKVIEQYLNTKILG